jgi:hypothetical protein
MYDAVFLLVNNISKYIEPIKTRIIIRCLKNVALDTSHANELRRMMEIEFVIYVQTPSTCMNSQDRGWIFCARFPCMTQAFGLKQVVSQLPFTRTLRVFLS